MLAFLVSWRCLPEKQSSVSIIEILLKCIGIQGDPKVVIFLLKEIK